MRTITKGRPVEVTLGQHYLSFALSPDCQHLIQSLFPAPYPVACANHVTIAYRFAEEDVARLQRFVDSKPEFQITEYIRVDGIDLFKVAVNGNERRPLGGTFHLVNSRTEARSSSDSNKVLYGEIAIERSEQLNIALDGAFELIDYPAIVQDSLPAPALRRRPSL